MSPWVIVRILGNYHSRMHIYIYIHTVLPAILWLEIFVWISLVRRLPTAMPKGNFACSFVRKVLTCVNTQWIFKKVILTEYSINLTDMFWLSTINLIRHCVSRFPRLPLLLSFKNNHRPDWEVGPWNQRVPEGSREWGRRTHLLSKKPTKIQAL